MVLFAMNQLVSSLAEVIGAEAESGKAIAPDWARDADEEILAGWRSVGLAYGEEIEKSFMQTFREEYKTLYAKVGMVMASLRQRTRHSRLTFWSALRLEEYTSKRQFVNRGRPLFAYPSRH